MDMLNFVWTLVLYCAKIGNLEHTLFDCKRRDDYKAVPYSNIKSSLNPDTLMPTISSKLTIHFAITKGAA